MDWEMSAEHWLDEKWTAIWLKVANEFQYDCETDGPE